MHPLDRPHQLDTYNKIMDSQCPYIVVEGPTGSGKTAWPARVGNDGIRTLALVKTKSLQTQYRESYDFMAVMGKSNYSCDFGLMPDASLCKMTRHEREESGCLDGCPYPHACVQFLGSNLGSLNYSKYLLETQPRGLVREFNPQVLFLDEAHQLSDQVIDWSGCTFTWQQYGKPAFILNYTQPLQLTDVNTRMPDAIQWKQKQQRMDDAIDWLGNLLGVLVNNEPPKPNKNSTTEEIKHYKKWDNLTRKVGTTIDLVEQGKEYWYVESNDIQFRLKPLTARFHFPYLFRAPKIVLMSATIGQPNPFMAELGIYQDFESIVVPNIWSPESRPVIDLHAPSYRAKMTEQERQEHAQIIANFLNDCPSQWNGLIHAQGQASPGTKMVHDLAGRLTRLTGRPLWLPSLSGMEGTEQALASWLEFERHNKGAIAITHQFYEGVDLPNLNINLTARIPYPDFGDQYETERFNFDKKAALVRIANMVRQQQGRNRRGYPKHYGPQATKVNAIADGKWDRLKKQLGSDFVEAIC